MSRRSTLQRFPFSTPIGIGLSMILTLGLLIGLPVATAAQDSGDELPRILGRNWQLLEYRDQNGGLEPVPPGIAVRFYLWAGTFDGKGACGAFLSDYTLQKETLIVDEPSVTGRACDPAAQAIDDDFLRNVTDTAVWSVDGSVLELRDPVGDVVMTLTEALIPNDPTIAPWQLARIAASDGSIGPVIPGTDPSIQFLRGGRLVGTTGCGWFVGSYSTNDNIMTISDVQSRQDECTAELRAQANNVIQTFADISEFEVLPAGLTLQGSSGVTKMALVPSIPLGRRTWTPIAVLDDQGESIVERARLRTSAVRFAGTRADGRTVCRSYAANSLRSGLALSVFDVDGAKAACRKKAQKGQKISQLGVERLFLERLEMAASHALRGSELELMDASGKPIMRLLPQPDLVGVPWVLSRMDVTPKARKSRLRAPKGTQPLTAEFTTIEVLQGETGKNGYFSDYRTPRASLIEIEGTLTDGRSCKGRKARNPLCLQEAAFINLLEAANGYVVAPEGLSLLKGSRKLMEFARAGEILPETN